MTTNYTIGEHSITLSTPRSMALRWEIFGLGAHNTLRASAAALAACWTGPGKPKSDLGRCQWNTGRWAAAIIDELLGRGVPLDAIAAVGALAFNLVATDLLTEEDVTSTGNGSGEEAPSIG